MDEENLLYEILKETDLLNFQDDLALKLQITKIEHFDHVKDSDLKNIGLSQPAIRRLQKAVKDKRNTLKKSKTLEKVNLSTSPEKIRKDSPKVFHRNNRENSHSDPEPTCLIAREDIKLFEALGEGSFGVVKRAIWSQGVGKKLDVAVKCLRNNDGFAEEFMGEVDRMHKLKHPNLIRLYGLVVSKPLMMVVELCSGGALLDRLRHTQKPVLLLTQLLNFGVQIVEGMSYLETKSFIHRDLATRNILLATEDERVVKIGDFGLMRALRNHEEHYVMTGRKKVPFAWCPPESLIKRQFSHASDVWSFGVTLWEMFSYGEEPWCGYSGPEVLQKVNAGERLAKPDACPLSIYQLMKQSWSAEPSQRPTFAALKVLLKEAEIQRGDSKESQTGEGLLEIVPGDKIVVVDGGPESYYWYGQNVRTRKFGKFARKLVALDSNKVTAKDISQPIKGSFVHTGHGDGKGGTSWGHPDKIDDIYLRNPMPLIDFHDEEKKKLQQTNFDNIAIPKPPRSDRLSSRNNYYGGGGGAAPSDSPKSYTFDPFEPAADAVSFTSAGTSTDESKGSSKSIDSWRNNSPPAFEKTYYSMVPPDMYNVPPPTYNVPPPSSSNDVHDQARLYDQVPQDPDPFEVSTQIKDLTKRQRYSDMYSPIVKPSPPPITSPINEPSPFRRPVIPDQFSSVRSPSKTKSSVDSPSSSSTISKTFPVSPHRQQPSHLNFSFTSSTSDSLQTPTNVVCNNLQNVVAYGECTNVVVSHSHPSSPHPPPPTFSATTVQQATTKVQPSAVVVNDYGYRQSLIASELNTRLIINNSTSIRAVSPMTLTNNVQPQAQPQMHFNNVAIWPSLAGVGGYATAFSSANSNLFYQKQTQQQQQHNWILPGQQNGGRTSSEPDVSRSGVLQPVTVRKSFGDGLDSTSPTKSTAPKQVLDLFDPLADKPPGDLVEQVNQAMPGVSRDRCGQVLKRCNLDVKAAVQELKIQKLVDIGLGSREECARVLSKYNWDIDVAASSILG